MNGELLAAVAAFLLLYILLMGDWFHRAWSSLAVAGLLLAIGIAPMNAVWDADNLNTLSLLLGMMLLVALLSQSGFFSDLERGALRIAAGRPWRLFWTFFVVTAVTSAFLDNVTTVLLLSPGLIRAAEALDLDPVPFLMAEVVASNLGGLATLVGDPPNILIGSAAHWDFGRFLGQLAPVALVLLATAAWGMRRWVRLKRDKTPRSRPAPELAAAPLPPLAPQKPFLLIWMGVTLLALAVQHVIHLGAGTIALASAGFAIAWTRPPALALVRSVDWGTIGFFLGIFVMVGALLSSGAIAQTAHFIAAARMGGWLPIFILVFSATASAVLDNVPLVAALIPVIQEILAHAPGYGLELWIALAVGAAVGGNATVIGASANVVVQGIAYEHGYAMDFGRYLGFGVRVAGLTLLAAIAYLLLAFHIFPAR